MPSSTAAPPPQIDPRVARSRSNILDTTAELLVEGGASAVTIERVAERSGVAKTTIYRHWSSRSQLLFDAFKSLLVLDSAHAKQLGMKPGPIRETLVHALSVLMRGLTDSRWAPTVSALVDAADRDVEMRQLIHDFLLERMAPARLLVQAAVERGELAAHVDAELAVDMLAGALFYRRLISGEPLGDRLAERIVDQFLTGAAPRS